MRSLNAVIVPIFLIVTGTALLLFSYANDWEMVVHQDGRSPGRGRNKRRSAG
jgi:hypothetical protein